MSYTHFTSDMIFRIGITTWEHWIAEFIGTIGVALAAVGTAGVLKSFELAATTSDVSLLVLALSSFIVPYVYSLALQAAGANFGGRVYSFNPFLTMYNMAIGALGIIDGLGAIVVQFVGWFIGGIILRIVFSPTELLRATVLLGGGYSTTRLFFLQMLAAFVVLCIGYFHSNVSNRSATLSKLIVGVGAFMYRFTGGYYNPFRYLGPAAAAALWDSPEFEIAALGNIPAYTVSPFAWRPFAVYVLAPAAAGIAAYVLVRFVTPFFFGSYVLSIEHRVKAVVIGEQKRDEPVIRSPAGYGRPEYA